MDTQPNSSNRLKEESQGLKKEIKERTASYIVAALSLVAGLAWNEAIRGLIEYLFPLSKDSLWVKFVYAVIITVVVVFISIYLMRFLGKQEDKK